MEGNKPSKFEHPSLPFAWLASTFIAPVLVLILPEIFKDEQISWAVRIAIALGVFSVMLVASLITLVLKFYELSYSLQVVRFKMDQYQESNPMDAISAEIRELEASTAELHARLDMIEASGASPR